MSAADEVAAASCAEMADGVGVLGSESLRFVLGDGEGGGGTMAGVEVEVGDEGGGGSVKGGGSSVGPGSGGGGVRGARGDRSGESPPLMAICGTMGVVTRLPLSFFCK